MIIIVLTLLTHKSVINTDCMTVVMFRENLTLLVKNIIIIVSNCLNKVIQVKFDWCLSILLFFSHRLIS